ncbi:hypothetical protein A2U01_0011734, partial [Trifolium medium]|nr:hypothetical protein [Trifolium medium]
WPVPPNSLKKRGEHGAGLPALPSLHGAGFKRAEPKRGGLARFATPNSKPTQLPTLSNQELASPKG